MRGQVIVVFAQLLCLAHSFSPPVLRPPTPPQWRNEPDPSNYACAGSSVELRWDFKEMDNVTIVGLNWIRDDSMGSTLIATKLKETFIATRGFAGRVQRLAGSHGGLVLQDANTDDSGNYTLEVQMARGSEFESLRSTVNLQVSDGPMVQGGVLKVTQDPIASWDHASKQWHLHLTCGPFSFLGHAPFLNITWRTPDGGTLSSTGYEGDHYYLALTSTVQGGNYSCVIPPESLPKICYDGQGAPLTATVIVDETKARLSVLEANQRNVLRTGVEIETTLRDVETTHERDIDNETFCQDSTSGMQDVVNLMRKEQNSLKEMVDLAINKTVVAVGPCRTGYHKILDDSWRDSSLGKTGILRCDDDLSSGWYRFLLNSQNAIIPTTCVPKNHCNTHATEWMDLKGQVMPAPGQEVSGRTCANWDGNCCRWEAPAKVRNCGLFFLYYLSPRSNCHLAHCTQRQ